MGKLHNVKIDGIKESANEDLIDRVSKLAEAMGSQCQASDIDRVFRLGRKQNNQTRPRTIMIVFRSLRARHEFFNSRLNLKNKKEWSRVWVNDDVSEQTRRR